MQGAMRTKILIILYGSMCARFVQAQDTLRTIMLKEVVTTGTKFEVPLEKSGKTIYKLTAEDLSRNAGKSVGDLLNEIPGIQTDGNFGTPGTNISYYVRGARNTQTLVLIDGVPLNDPSAINAEYDLRYIPVSQVESIEVLKGGLSTLYGTGAAASVIDIRLKDPGKEPLSGNVDLNAASFNTYAQNIQAGGTKKDWSYMVMINNIQSQGFSAALNSDPGLTYDKDGFSRQNILVKGGYRVSPNFEITAFTAYEKFKADYDEYEFTDGTNVQRYHQHRLGLNPKWLYKKGELQAKVVYNVNERIFESTFPAEYKGKNLQAEIIQRHHFSNRIQGLFGLNYQHMTFDQEDAVNGDTATITMVDPYASFLVDLPFGLSVHAGLRLNTHSTYGSKVVYNVNPSFLFNQNGAWNYKVLASVSSSYVTPSLYQLYSIYGNKELLPQEALNVEAGVSAYGGEKWKINFVWFRRDETQPIDFVSLFDNDGNYIGGRYENLTAERIVHGVEISVGYKLGNVLSASLNYVHNDSDRPESFYRIPKEKWGAVLYVQPARQMSLSVKYAYTGDRTDFDFSSFSEVKLGSYQLVDLYASYAIIKQKFVFYGAVNNVFDEQFIAVLGYTTRGRNYSIGLRLNF
jgi:vitamin B12 transporter